MSIQRIALIAAAAAAGTFAQGLPVQKVLTLDLAQSIAQDALAKCRADGYKVGVTVVDGTNNLKTFLRDDGSNMVTIEVGRRKTNERPSGPPANLAKGAPNPPTPVPNIIYAQGGLPIKVGNDLIGRCR